MFIQNGIAYAGEAPKLVQVCGVRALDGHRLWVRFTTGEAKLFDFSPLLNSPAFRPLQDEKLFRQVYIDYGTPVWQDGDIDIAPEYLYEHAQAL